MPNKLSPDGLVKMPHINTTEKIPADTIQSTQWIIDMASSVWEAATTAQRDAMLTEIEAIGKNDLDYLLPHHRPHTHAEAWLLKKNPHGTPNTCPACAVIAFKKALIEKLKGVTHAKED